MPDSSKPHTLIVAADPKAGLEFALRGIAAELCRADKPPCLECSVCRRIVSGTHPDVHIIGDGIASIKVEEIRDFISEENVRPLEAEFKSYIIVGADLLTEAGQNAILKTLEEPSGDTLFYLTAEKPGMLLPTIVSRAAMTRPKKESQKAIRERLRAAGCPDGRISMSAMLSNGSSARALAIASDEAFFGTGDAALAAMLDVISRSLRDVTRLTKFSEKKETLRAASAFWQALFRDCVAECGSAACDRYFDPAPAGLRECADRLGVRSYTILLDALGEMMWRIDRNVSPNLALDSFLNELARQIYLSRQ